MVTERLVSLGGIYERKSPLWLLVDVGSFSCFPINTSWKLFSVLIFFIEVKLIYSVVLISAV